jgi:nitroreductase/NAD-dependent dihydropyrimidine dehydrogenase PreA subunit
MVSIDLNKCTECGICYDRFKDYCISVSNKTPVINYDICNQCQKCIAICPNQAILMNNIAPEKIINSIDLDPEKLEDFLSRRRSIKKFKNERISDEIINRIVNSASYAPNQNKNLGILVINDFSIFDFIDKEGLKFLSAINKILFSFKFITKLISFFISSKQVISIKTKINYDLFIRKHIMKENTQVLIITYGNPKIPVTESSAPFLLANMIIMSEALGVGSTLMDSLKMTIHQNKKVRHLLNIPEGFKVFGVLAIGYSNENIINIPQGYKIPVSWNKIS